jgi:serine/threonine protein kinase
LDPTLRPILVRFGVFELDLRARELRKNGLSTGLPEQSIKILALLLAKPGEVILREEIRKSLWPNDTVVEFDHSINAAIKRLRQALDDPAEAPQYVETLARRGYRWKSSVQVIEHTPEPLNGSLPKAPVQPAGAGNLIGKKVSHYRVLGVLGGGGMGVVFSAEDLKLGRRVALKFLPDETAEDASALLRFEQEARAASALNHPNICTIYEVEEHDGQPFIVMELLEGQTLRELITGGGNGTLLPHEKVIELALQISDGLEAAHLKGIIHRDIKPANVFVTNQGQVKILDFGLAKLAASGVSEDHSFQAQASSSHSTNTISDLSLSLTGVAMGTAGYMSPEQVRGEKLDPRTDLFSFGLVLYEMLAGERAFTGETVPLLHSAILNRKPTPLRQLNPAIPAKLEEIVNKALIKDRALRYQNAAEIRSALSTVRSPLRAKPSVRFWRTAIAGLIAVGFLAGATWWLKRMRSPSFASIPDLKLQRLTSNSTANRVTSGAISPDGRYLAYADLKGVWIKLIESGEVRGIPEPPLLAGKSTSWEVVHWFPDSIHFLLNAHPASQDSDHWSSPGSSIWKASVLAEAPRKLRDEAIAYSISPSGLLVSFGTNKGIFGEHDIWVMSSTGDQARLFHAAEENSAAFGLTWTPDTDRVSYIESGQAGDKLISRNFDGGPTTTLLPTADFTDSQMKKLHDFSWLPDGRLIYSLDSLDGGGKSCDFWVMRMDSRTGRIVEPAKKITNWTGFCMAGLSTTADGRRLSFLQWESRSRSYLGELAAGGSQLLRPRLFPTSESSEAITDWMPDGKSMLLSSDRSGYRQMYKLAPDREQPEPIVGTEVVGRDIRITPDGKWFLFYAKSELSPTSKEEAVMRIPFEGGKAEFLLFGKRDGLILCPKSPAAECAIAETTDDHKQVTISALDPLRGRGNELVRYDIDTKKEDWVVAMSPDGSRLAAIVSLEKPISIISLRGLGTDQVKVKGWQAVGDVSWAADGKSLFGFSPSPEGRTLLQIDLNGKARFLWEMPGTYGEVGAVASPDGRYLALEDWTLNSNIWMIEDF